MHLNPLNNSLRQYDQNQKKLKDENSPKKDANNVSFIKKMEQTQNSQDGLKDEQSENCFEDDQGQNKGKNENENVQQDSRRKTLRAMSQDESMPNETGRRDEFREEKTDNRPANIQRLQKLNKDLAKVNNKCLRFDDFLVKLQKKYKMKDQKQREKEVYEQSKNESSNFIGRSSKEFKSGTRDPMSESSESPKNKILSSKPSSNAEDLQNPEQHRSSTQKPMKVYSTIPIQEEETPELSPTYFEKER